MTIETVRIKGIDSPVPRVGLGVDDLRHIDGLLAEHITDPVGPEFLAPPLRQV